MDESPGRRVVGGRSHVALSPKPAGLRALALNLVIALLSAAAGLALLECAVRVLDWPQRGFIQTRRIANTKGAEVRAGTTALLCYPSNPRGYFPIDLRRDQDRRHYESIGMRRIDEAVAETPFAVEYRYNSGVFRGPEFPPKRPGVRRIVVIGDSFTEGWGVKEEDTYPKRLEDALSKRQPRLWEVLNCGQANSDFPRLWFSFRRALALEPDVVIYGMVLNDAETSERLDQRRNSMNNLIVLRGGASWRTLPLKRVLGVPSKVASLADDAYQMYRIEHDTRLWYRDVYSDANFAGWQRTKEHIRKMEAFCRERGIDFVVALWPLLIGLEGEYPFEAVHQRINGFAAKSGVRLHDLLPVLRVRPSSDLWAHAVDRHPNEVAHRLAAESLAGLLLADLAAPDR